MPEGLNPKPFCDAFKHGFAFALIYCQCVGDIAQAALFDWGGGLVWMVGGSGDDAGAASIRDAVARFGGHATLVRASEAQRVGVEVFQPLAPALMTLN